MIVDLVRTTTEDGIRLDGAVQSSAATRRDIVVIGLHGVGGNFYGSTLFDDLAETWLSRGCDLLRVNTRGHGGFSFAMGRPRQGAAYEIVDNCRLDIAAWVTFAVEQLNCSRVILAGHSLGAIKAIYTVALEQPAAVAGLIAMSAPRLSNAAFQNGENSAAFFADMAEAERLLQAGQKSALIEARVPFPILISAECYIDKYGPKERYNILKYIERLSCPTLFTYGALELEHGGIAFAGLPEAISQRHLPEQLIEVHRIPDADHMYTGVRPALAECIGRWMDYLSPAKN